MLQQGYYSAETWRQQRKMAFALLNKRDPREVPYKGADISVPVGRGKPWPCHFWARPKEPGLKVTTTFFTSQPQIKASLAHTSALFTCKSQQHLMGKLCTQTCSVMSEMVVYVFVFSKYLLCYARFLGEQGQAQGNFRLHFWWLDCSTDSLPACQ